MYLFSTLPVHVCFVFRLLRLPNPSPVNRILWRLHFHEQLKQTKINTETKHENSIHHHDMFEYTTLNMKLMWVQGGKNCWLFIGTSYFIHLSYIFWPKYYFKQSAHILHLILVLYYFWAFLGPIRPFLGLGWSPKRILGLCI